MVFSCVCWLKIHQHVLLQDILELGVKVGVGLSPRPVLASDNSALLETHLCTPKLHLHRSGGGEGHYRHFIRSRPQLI